MPKIFTDEHRENLRTELLDKGFKMLRQGGISAVNIDILTADSYIAKGTFYNLFENKSQFMYHMMLHERTRAKEMLESYYNDKGLLTSTALKNYFLWLASENPNIFAYMNDAEKKRLVSSWKDEYIDDEDNDSKTMHALISRLDAPADHPDWQLACNYLKLIAVSLTTKNAFIRENFDAMISSLIDNIIDILFYQPA